MAVLNSDVLTRAWLSGSNMFQQRIPNPAINSYANVVAHLFAPMNNDLFNEFSGLLNGLNATYVDIKRWEHGLRVLKKPASDWGNSERHVAVKFLQAHAGKWDDETLLKVERPEFVEWFYSVGEPRRYDFSWSKQEMARAFAQDGYGYDALLTATITQMLNSAEYDELQIMLQMFAEADNRMGGLYRYHLDKVPTDKASAEQLMIGVRATANRMEIAPTMMYNHIPVPVVEDASTLVFWCTPEIDAVVDVTLLAAVFNMDKADVKYRKIVIPEFPIPNVVAALTSEDFIYYRDFMTGLEPPFYNPGNRTMKYYYWANGMIGFNPAANCVLFTTDEATTIPTITMTPSGLEFAEATATAPIGGEKQLALNLTGTVTGNTDEAIAVEPDAALFTVAAVRGTAAVPLNTRTYVDAYGVLHIQKSDVQAGDVITVTAKSAYINPSGATTSFTATCAVTLTAAEAPDNKETLDDKPFIQYTDEKDADAPADDASEDDTE
jgi:hypothetical protein